MTLVDDNNKSDFMLYPITMNMFDKLRMLIWYCNVNLWLVVYMMLIDFDLH